jgi:hypothetical protein
MPAVVEGEPVEGEAVVAVDAAPVVALDAATVDGGVRATC